MPVHLDMKGRIAILTVDDGFHNRFNRSYLDAMNAILDELESGEKARALVITNEGGYFAEGMDVEWVITLTEGEIERFMLDLFKFLHRMFLYPLPVVAAIKGHVVASGLAFALCSDYRIMRSDRAVCIFPEIDLRIVPPPGCLRMVVHAIGSRTTEIVFLQGNPYRGSDALKVGLVDEVVPEGDVIDRAVAVAEKLADKSQTTYAAIKRSLRFGPARNMLEDDERFIRDSRMAEMFQSCDLECLKSL
jgi:enoyl-CoA hydratase/carnithine racemase